MATKKPASSLNTSDFEDSTPLRNLGQIGERLNQIAAFASQQITETKIIARKARDSTIRIEERLEAYDKRLSRMELSVDSERVCTRSGDIDRMDKQLNFITKEIQEIQKALTTAVASLKETDNNLEDVREAADKKDQFSKQLLMTMIGIVLTVSIAIITFYGSFAKLSAQADFNQKQIQVIDRRSEHIADDVKQILRRTSN